MEHYDVRQIAEDESRAAHTVLLRSLHQPPDSDELWEYSSASFSADRTFSAFADGNPVGTASSFGTDLAVPGGKQVQTAAVDGVGVRADHRRRGVFSRLMRAQLADCRDRGDVLAILHASETTIYGRVGYGIATHGVDLRINTSKASLRADAPAGGRVQLLEAGEAVERLPKVYAQIAPYRAGMITRPAVWWPGRADRLLRHERDHQAAVHIGPDGADGFVLYQTIVSDDHTATLRVRDLHGANTAARVGLWRFLLGMDLVREVEAAGRPADEPVGAVLVDPRACKVTGMEDQLWLRLIDVPAALHARTYGSAEPVVIEVADQLLPENAGRYLITPDGAQRTEQQASIRMDVDALAMLYLGEWSPSTLADIGRISTDDPAEVAALDGLLGASHRPWCGTGF